MSTGFGTSVESRSREAFFTFKLRLAQQVLEKSEFGKNYPWKIFTQMVLKNSENYKLGPCVYFITKHAK